MKAVAKPVRAAKRPAAKAPVRASPSDARLVTMAVIAVAALVVGVRVAAHPTGPEFRTHQVVMLCFVAAVVAGRLLLGHRPAAREEAGWLRDRLALPLVFLVAVLPYLLTVGIGLLGDDFAIEATAQRVHGPVEAFLTNPLPSMYRQLFVLGWYLHNHLFGNAPLGHHIANMLLHGANAVLVYIVGRRLTRRASAALVAALVFGLHPVHIEALDWLCSQPDLLCALFSLLSLLLLDVYLQSRRRWALPAAVVAFFFAMLGKEAALMLPAIAVLLVWLKQRPTGESDAAAPPPPFKKTAWLVGGTYSLALAAYIAIRLSALHAVGGYTVPIDFWNTVFPTMALRQILTFFVPVNQALTDHLGGLLALAVAVTVMTAFMVWCSLNLTRLPGRRLTFYGASFALLMAPLWLYRPPEADLAGTRWMYLPSVVLCWLVGELLTSQRSVRRFALTATTLTVLLALLVWYQMPWRAAGRTVEDLMGALRRVAAQTPSSVQHPVFYVQDVPLTHDGAEVFPTSFAAAVRLRVGTNVLAQTVGFGSEIPPEMLASSPLLPGEYVYRWDEKARTLRFVREGRP